MGRRVWVVVMALCACSAQADESPPADTDDVGASTGGAASSTTASDVSTSVGGESTSTGAVNPYDGAPLDVPADGAWHFVEIEGMACNGGVPSGVGVRRVEGATRLVLYFKGGGACFNSLTCSFTAPLMLTGPEAMEANPEGVLDFSRDDNPLIDANVVYMPYCTGDVHAGVRGEQSLVDVEDPWNFVGHDNVLAALERVVPTFAEPEQLVVLGTSAGGMGALLNFPFIRAGWPQTQTVVIDDSGVILPDDYLDPCLQTHLRDTWGFTDLLPDACQGCTTAQGGGLATVFEHLPQAYPDVRFALIASNRDQILRLFYGFGNDGCASAGGLPDLGEARYTEGLATLYTQSLQGGFVLFEVDSDVHTWSTTAAFYTTQTAGSPMSQWVADVLQGTAATVRP